MYALARMAWPAVCWPVLFSRALVAFKAFKMVTRVRKADEHFAPKHILLLGNTLLLKSMTHFAAQHAWQSHNLLFNTPCSQTPFASQNPFASWSPLLLNTFYFLEHFAPLHSLLHSTLCILEHFTS